GPCYFASLHRAERLVDVLEPAARGDHLVEQQSPLPVELQVERNIAAKTVRAHAGCLYLALGADRHPRELEHRVGRQDTDDRRRPANGEALDGLPAELRVADRLERVIHARATGEGS